MSDNKPSVYVGTYAKYNNGSIEGAWIDLTQFKDNDEFIEYCENLHKDESDPEFMIQDYENFPAGYYSESGLDPDIWDWLALDEDDRELLEAYHEAGFEGGIDEARNAYYGYYESDYDFACDMLESSGDIKSIPEHLSYYFDYDKYAQDLMINDFTSGNNHYFRNY